MSDIQKEIVGRIAQLKSEVKELWADCERLRAENERLRQERDELKRFAYEGTPRIAAEEANKQTVELKTEIERLRQELSYIANAQRKNSYNAAEFRAWAQNRARHALGQEAGTLTVKKS